LLAAVARDQVAGTRDRAKPPGGLDEDGVAGRVAVLVVDLLEVVEVEHEEPDAARAAAAGSRELERLLEEATVVQGGEPVGDRELVLRLERALELARDRVLLPPRESLSDADRERAVDADRERGEGEAAGAGAGERHRHPDPAVTADEYAAQHEEQERAGDRVGAADARVGMTDGEDEAGAAGGDRHGREVDQPTREADPGGAAE